MAVEIPQLNSCCCGCTLKTGTKIIGWMELIGGIIFIVTFGISVAALTHFQDHPESVPSDIPSKDEFLKLIPIMKALLYGLIVVSLVSSCLAFMLLLGVYQTKPQLVMIWVTATLVTTFISACIGFAQVISFQNQNIFSPAISFLINIYFVLVVYSFYREIRNGPPTYA